LVVANSDAGQGWIRRTTRLRRRVATIPVTVTTSAAASAAALGLVVGLLTSISSTAALLASGLVLSLVALRTRPSTLVVFAFVSAWVTQVATTVFLLPRALDFLNLPVTALAFLVVLLRPKGAPRSPNAVPLSVVFVPLVAFGVSTVLSQSSPFRLGASALLYLQPLLAVAAFTRVPLSTRQRRTAMIAFTAVVAVQLPVALFQAAQSPIADSVQGTLVGTGAGHHVLGSVALVGFVAIAAFWRWSPPTVAALSLGGLLIALLSDSKVPLFVIPAVMLALVLFRPPKGASRDVLRGRRRVLGGSVLMIGAVWFAVSSAGFGGDIGVKIANTADPSRGKQRVAITLAQDLRESAESAFFGFGPAETVSRMAQLTTPSGKQDGSPVDVLGLAPAARFDEYTRATRISAGQGSSLTSATSSTLGLLGDFGIVGLLAYGWAWLLIARRVWGTGTRFGYAVMTAWVAMPLLGLAYDWLEQPPYTLAAALLAGVALTGTTGSAQDLRRRTSAPVVTTEAGAVAGSFDRAPDGTVLRRFLGIPYGAPPVGDLRWRAPEPPSPWPGTRPAFDFAPAAPQGTALESRLPGFRPDHPTDEDCLALNVWTPGLHGARPVLVWFPGGAYLNGATAQPVYEAARLAAEANAVVVTVGYRLGALGFLAPEGDGVANCGLRDQVAALDWVQHHAAAFGGNPGNVTVMGESAGAGSVLHLLASPIVAATPRFHRAIVQSAQPVTLTASQARAVADTFAGHLGLERADAEALRSVPVEQLLAAQAATSAEMLAELGPMAFAPTIDDDVCDTTIVDSLAAGRSAGIPIVIGTTRDELALFALPDDDALDDARLLRRAARLLGEDRDAEDAVDQVRQRLPETATNADVWHAVTTDVMMRDPMLRVADAHSTAGGTTFVYRFDWAAPGLGAAHGVDLPFTFGTADREGWDRVVGWDRRAEALGREWRAAWSYFAATGDPSTTLRHWPPHDPADPAVMVFSADTIRAVPGLDASVTPR